MANKQTKQTKQNENVDTRVDADLSAEQLYEKYETWSAAFRALAAQGYSRSEIAKRTGKIYQFVRGVLVQQAAKAKKASKDETVEKANENWKLRPGAENLPIEEREQALQLPAVVETK